MAKIVRCLMVVNIVFGAVACGSGNLTPNDVEPIDCTQDDGYSVQPIAGNIWNLATQDQTFKWKMEREGGNAFVGEGAYVGQVKLPRPRCAPTGDDLAFRLWTVSQYTKWGQGVDIPGFLVDPAALGYEGISFWAKALVDEPTDQLSFVETRFREPQVKPDKTKTPEDVVNTLPETPADFAARLPKPVTASAVVRVTIATKDTATAADDAGHCIAPPSPAPPPLQVQDGSDECYDGFSVAVYPPSHWKFYTIPFVELRQTGWGKPVNFLDSGHVTGIQITLGPFADYDFVIDDFGFYKRVSP